MRSVTLNTVLYGACVRAFQPSVSRREPAQASPTPSRFSSLGLENTTLPRCVGPSGKKKTPGPPPSRKHKLKNDVPISPPPSPRKKNRANKGEQRLLRHNKKKMIIYRVIEKRRGGGTERLHSMKRDKKKSIASPNPSRRQPKPSNLLFTMYRAYMCSDDDCNLLRCPLNFGGVGWEGQLQNCTWTPASP